MLLLHPATLATCSTSPLHQLSLLVTPSDAASPACKISIPHWGQQLRLWVVTSPCSV